MNTMCVYACEMGSFILEWTLDGWQNVNCTVFIMNKILWAYAVVMSNHNVHKLDVISEQG